MTDTADLLRRLREHAPSGMTQDDAADEIERLRAECVEMRGERDVAELSRDAAHAEYERLRARLAEAERTIAALSGFRP